jgi:RTX calcium-binding nonapeptide repeat (4 copies)
MIRAVPGATRALVVAALVTMGAGALVPVAHARSKAELAARAMRLDPGARIGGNTQVATAAGARVLGVPGRVNFMVALGARERIVGGAGHDQLQARGSADRIFGAGGPDLIHGGRGDVLDGGPGDDLIIDDQGGATVRTGPGSDKVIAPGRGDLVVCAAGSHDDLIYADRSDTIAPSCRRNRSRVLYRPAPALAPRAAHTAQLTVSGDGSNDHPYTAPCDNPGLVDCTASSFAARTLRGWLANEYVPAYQCPSDHPYLFNDSYNPFGTALPAGVEVLGLGPIGVSILGVNTAADVPWAIGTFTGFGISSATNWKGGDQSYQVVLHCTSDTDHAYIPFHG